VEPARGSHPRHKPTRRAGIRARFGFDFNVSIRRRLQGRNEHVAEVAFKPTKLLG
jgi:hypothetical protein